MENLHLSYKEVFEVIPYRNLVIMQKDKLRESGEEDNVTFKSGREMFNAKMNK